MKELSMKKFIANLFVAIALTISITTFVSANSLSNIQIKSAINTAGTGMCMDVANGQTAPGTAIGQYPCHSGINQRFTFQTIVFDGQRIIKSNLNPNMCVGITDNTQANSNTLLRLVPCFDSTGDVPLGARWYLDIVNGKERIRAKLTSWDNFNTCIDVPSGLASPSLWLQIYYCQTGGNQQWIF